MFRIFDDPDTTTAGTCNDRHVKEIEPWTWTRKYCSVVGVSLVKQYFRTLDGGVSAEMTAKFCCESHRSVFISLNKNTMY